MIPHRICDHCLEENKIVIGEINIFNIKKDKLEMVCDAHFDKLHPIQFTKGIFGFAYFHDKDGREWRWDYNDTNSGFVE